MIDRRALLAGAGALCALPVLAKPAQPQSLRRLAAAKGLMFGTAAANYELRDADFVPVLTREAAILVPEYETNRRVVEPRPGIYDFSAGDALWNFAHAHGMAMRGHPLVWYNANPTWLEPLVLQAKDEKLLTDYIAKLAGHYRGRMHSWDVVNEALAPDGSGWRDCFWLKRYGPAYVDLAFHAARAADPHALLVYNDYGCEQGEPVNDRLRARTLTMLDGLRKRHVPVQALGLQAHLSAFGPKVDQKKLHAFLGEIHARGLAVLITELDVDDEGGPSDFASRDRAVADEAARFLDVALDSPATRALLTWSLSDRYLDLPQSWRLQLLSWRDRRVPYDAQMQPKPLRAALAKALAGRRVPS